MKFFKYQATGNDFILLDFVPQDAVRTAQVVCDRHFGIGADGLIFAEASSVADRRMHYYNADGSRARMCGNGLRCFVRFLMDQDQLSGNSWTIETDAAVLLVELNQDFVSIRLPIDDQAISMQECTQALSDIQALRIDHQDFYIARLTTLHAICFVDTFEGIDALGPHISAHPYFPDHINVNFVRIIDSSHCEVRTHERGAGWTLSCGTGVAASVLVASQLGKTSKQVMVQVLGGILHVKVENECVFLEGPAQKIAEGQISEVLI
jgi:diaminopimelate epimerase